MVATLILYTVVVPLGFGLIAALIARPQTRLWHWLPGLLALAGAAVLWLIDGPPALPPVAAKHKLLLLAAAVVPLAAFGQSVFATTRAKALAFLAFGLIALLLLGSSRITDLSLLPRFLAVALYLGLTALGLNRLDQTRNEAFTGASALLATNIALALCALLSAHIGGGQLGGALAAVTGGWLLARYAGFALGRADAVPLPDMALWGGFALTSLVLIQTGLFAPSTSVVSVVLLALPLLGATIWPGPLTRNRLAAPILSGVAAILAASPSVIAAAL